MVTASIIASIVSIVVALGSAGVTVYNTALQALNQGVRNKIQSLMTTINSELSAGRLKLAKLVSLLNGKNQHALMTYLYSNPIVTKSVSDLNKDAALINKYQNELQAIESEIESYKAEMGGLGYSQSHSGVTKENKKSDELNRKIKDAQSRYNSTLSEMEKANIGSSTVNVKPYTADIDATTQNIKGGLV